MLRFHNTLTRRIEPFQPLEPPKVRMYNCGPTVYSSQHIGNFRTYVFTDLLRRYLDFKGFEVTQVMNITDVGHLRDEEHDAGEDKIEAAARRENLDPWRIAEKYTREFFEGLDLFNIRRAHHYPRATDHVPEMIEMISGLIEKGYAYVVDGEVYFDVTKFPDYGKLSGNRPEDLVAGASERVDEQILRKKRHPRDFALWKVDPHHIMQWDAPWGRGFPGWHIECSAMARKYLGDTLDIHTGGENNIFPHHECEIAQSEALTGKPFVRYWLHCAHLNLEGEKMAKSEGNVLLPRDLVAEGFRPLAIRYYLLSVHYRQPMNFTRQALRSAQSAHERLVLLAEDLAYEAQHGAPGPGSQALAERTEAAAVSFEEALDDDLNVSPALAALFDWAAEVRKAKRDRTDSSRALGFLERVDEVLGVLPHRADKAQLDREIERKIREREEARRRRDFETADRIRDELAARGIELIDTKEGVRWRRRDAEG